MSKLYLIYSGNVQGVGFRYTAKQLADELKLTGYAKNLPDGRVEVLIQGEEKTLEDFQTRFEKEFAENISDVSTENIATGDTFNNFIVII